MECWLFHEHEFVYLLAVRTVARLPTVLTSFIDFAVITEALQLTFWTALRLISKAIIY